MNEGALHELPGGWVWMRLGDIADKINPGFPSGNHNKESHGIPHLRPMNINVKGEIELSEVKYVQPDSYDSLLKGDVLFNNTNSPELLGKTSYIKDDTNWAYSNHMTRIRINSSFLNSAWIAYYLHSLFLKGFFKMSCTHHVNQASINSTFLSQKVPIPLPPLPEQRAIVSKIEQLFSDLDSGINNFKKAQAQLKLYRQSVLKAACEGKLVPTEAELARAEGREYEAADVLLARILRERREKWNGKGKYKEPAAPDMSGLPVLPAGWCWSNVGQMTDSMKNGIYKAREFYAEVGFACLRMYNIDEGEIIWKDIKRMNLSKEEIDEYLLLPGDLLVNRVNSRELVGKAAVIPFGIEKCVFESKNIRVRVIDEIANPHYLCYRFSLEGTKYFNRNAQQVVGMASISQPQIARFPIPLPPLAEQRRIVSEVERRLSISDKLEVTRPESLQKAESLRQSILKKAFEGKLLNKKELEEARNAPDWEPAEKLLERIKAEKKNKKTEKGKK